MTFAVGYCVLGYLVGCGVMYEIVRLEDQALRTLASIFWPVSLLVVIGSRSVWWLRRLIARIARRRHAGELARQTASKLPHAYVPAKAVAVIRGNRSEVAPGVDRAS